MEKIVSKNVSKKMKSRALALVTAAALLFALMPLTAWAADYDDKSNASTAATAEAFALGARTEFGYIQTSEATYYEFRKYYKKFTVTVPSDLTVLIEAPVPTGAGFMPNRLEVKLLNPSGEDGDSPGTTDKKASTEVKSNSPAIATQTVHYKVLPGTYYIHARQWQSDYNGYGFVTVTATPVAQDPGGEPNDTQMLAKPIALNTNYSGNIGYHGKATTNATDYSQDWHDWYSFTVPKNNYGLNITFSRTNDGTQKNLTARLVNANEYYIGEDINLKNQVSVTKSYNIETAGTYYFQVNGWSMSSDDCTEYSFRINGVEATTITMQKTAKVEKGKSITLKPVVSPRTPARTLTWTSSDTSVATVSTIGVVTGKKAGTVNITARVNGVSGVYATCTVTVTQPVTKVKLNKKTLTLKKGAKYTLKATVTPKNATNKKLKWSSSNKKVAKVSSKGKVTAVKKGTATITVTTHNGKTYKCKVRVR